jgi:glycosyltransferase involved in cell wall biosynthesis
VNENAAIRVAPSGAPSIAVVIPTRDRASILHRALNSLRAQELTSWEGIVVDDGSEEDIEGVVRSYSDTRLRYARQAPAGAATARNVGVASTRSRLVTFLDSDDEAYPHWLSSILSTFENHESDVVCCGAELVFPPELHREAKANLPRDLGPMFGHRVGLFTQSGTYALRREVFTAIGGFTDGLPAAHHRELSLRLLPMAESQGWRIDVVDQPLVRYYLGASDGIRKDDRAVYEAASYIARTHRALLMRDPPQLANSLSVAGVRAARLGEYREARKHLTEALRGRRRSPQAWARLVLVHLPGLRRLVWRRSAS